MGTVTILRPPSINDLCVQDAGLRARYGALYLGCRTVTDAFKAFTAVHKDKSRSAEATTLAHIRARRAIWEALREAEENLRHGQPIPLPQADPTRPFRAPPTGVTAIPISPGDNQR